MELTDAPRYSLSRDDLLGVVSFAVATAEGECRSGHTVKQDEVTLAIWQHLIAELDRRNSAATSEAVRLKGEGGIALALLAECRAVLKAAESTLLAHRDGGGVPLMVQDVLRLQFHDVLAKLDAATARP